MLNKQLSNRIPPKVWKLTLRAIPTLLACFLLSFLAWTGIPPAAATPLPGAPIIGSLLHFSGNRPSNLGVQNGKLAACPTNPNCVSSQSQDSSHAIAPLRYSASPETAFSQLKAIIKSLPEANIITASDSYLNAEFTSALMGFVDDVEFYLDKSVGVIQVRSASRLGESDLGVNRKRVEAIRAALEKSA
ncbi:MAG: DUF1499 domain-containing protein [Kovacikia sp.]